MPSVEATKRFIKLVPEVAGGSRTHDSTSRSTRLTTGATGELRAGAVTSSIARALTGLVSGGPRGLRPRDLRLCYLRSSRKLCGVML